MGNNPDLLEINFTLILSILKKERWKVFFITVFFSMLGIVYSFSLLEEFESEGRILPELQSKGSGISQFAGLAALAGVDLSSATGSMDAIRPDLYPDVLKATPFYLKLDYLEVQTMNNKKEKFLNFYNNIILDGNQIETLSNFQKNENFIVFSKQTQKRFENLRKRITCSYDKKTGIIGIKVKMPDPVVAAEVTRFSMEYLTKYIIDYRTDKLKKDLIFLEKRLDAAKNKYYGNQSKKAIYIDRMPYTALKQQSADLERERIESDYKVSSTFYNSLLQKYEEAKLKLDQETPVIKVLEPPVVSNFKSEPKKSILVLIFTFTGLILSSVFVIIKDKNYKSIFN
jgi:uncharacterized protein involved in exopolysaccharide biosynthesis